MTESNASECSAAPTLAFACSGAADVGEITDHVARKLTRDGVAKMFCLAGVGGHVVPILNATSAAKRILAIDGCPLDCVRHTLEQGGFTDFAHLRVTDLGLKKGESAVTPELTAQVAEKAAALLNS